MGEMLDTAEVRQKAAPMDAEDFVVSRNACKLCTPLGAALAFKGVAGAINLLHGSQGCATYIRRYLISHFREPIDIASSNFTEHTTVFGGKNNLHVALDNLVSQYQPELIGVATTCLAETIGEDLPGILRGWVESRKATGLPLPALVGVNTPSYIGTHREGFQATVREIVRTLVDGAPASQPGTAASTNKNRNRVNLLPGMCSPADLRWLKETVAEFGLESTLVPDYSESLDGGLWSDYQAIPAGGATVSAIREMGAATASLDLGALPLKDGSAGSWLAQEKSVPLHSLDLPMGIGLTDRYLDALSAVSGQAIPQRLQAQRQRLADSYVDAHKYVAGLPVAVFGEEDFVVAMAAFLAETGLKPILCASGGKTGLMAKRLPELLAGYPGMQNPVIASGVDFVRLEEQAKELGVQMAIGSSKGYKLAMHLGIPLVRCGFPIHDRFGGGRLLHLGYGGAQELFDRIVNARLEARQSADTIGYTYF